MLCRASVIALEASRKSRSCALLLLLLLLLPPPPVAMMCMVLELAVVLAAARLVVAVRFRFGCADPVPPMVQALNSVAALVLEVYGEDTDRAYFAFQRITDIFLAGLLHKGALTKARPLGLA